MPNEPELISCVNMKGETMMLPREDATDRVGAYALIERGGSVLLFKLTENGKYFLPGGALEFELGEAMEDALRREVREEVGGLEIEIVEPLGVYDHFYYYDDTQSAWHAISHVFLCRMAEGFTEIPAHAGQPEEGYPEWLALEGLDESVLHPGIMARVMREYRERYGNA